MTMLNGAPPVLNVHTPTSSFAIIHSLTQESLEELYDKLSRKGAGHLSSNSNGQSYPPRIGPGWLKYEYNGSVWNLDDAVASSSRVTLPDSRSTHTTHTGHTTTRTYTPSASDPNTTPTLHLHNPDTPLPEPPAYCNASYYLFHPLRAHHCREGGGGSRAPSRAGSRRTNGSKKGEAAEEKSLMPKIRRDFEKFHSENGVRTVMGSIGPVENVRMLLKAGHRHVYISRKFAVRHGFIPPDSAPGNYGYGGLVSIGEWPITLTPSASQPAQIPQVIGQGADASTVRPDSASAFFNPNHHPHPSSPPRSLSHYSQSPYSSPRMGGPNVGSILAAPLLSTTTLIGGTPAAQPHANLNPSIKSRTPTINTLGTARSYHSTAGGKLTRAQRERLHANEGTAPKNGLMHVMLPVYLSEEPHFDVVLGRSFFEKRAVKKIHCEVVILKDGRGEIVTVT
ncbi:hypothetical protein DFP72DRAFT_873586 [Ephemerocybe angulata]|uniref:Uncharacterized protein n=1 Tax=Ephemerocybe angulata TaxID=980116 RepID=A0A8H6MCV6_9AGAR|nr:hypothetical protein DFP72DRAFT_873586 [Tulosesus angulatus]